MSMTTIMSGFYVTGGTLLQDAPSYVEREADRELYEGLVQGEYCYVLTARQMGKSSLMVRTAARLREAGVTVAVLDFTGIGQNLTPDQWYGGLLDHLGQQLELEEELEGFWLERQERLGPLQRWLRALQEVVLTRLSGPVVIFIDEIDVVRSLPFSTDEFFAGIRECYNRRSLDPACTHLTFCLLGVATPSDLIQDTRMTPFNIGRRINPTDFTEAEAAPLARGLRGDQRTGAMLLKRVLYWTGGHPYLTQRLCQAVAADSSARHPPDVDRHCASLFLTPSAREKDENLLFVRERLLRSEVDLASLLALYARVQARKRVPTDDTNHLVSLLRLSGITRVENGSLRVRNRIYERAFDRHWIVRHMPDAELRRQREAYRRGLARASAIAGVVVTGMAGLAGTAIHQAKRARTAEAVARQETTATRRFLYIANMSLAPSAWEHNDIGRLSELLAETRENDERGFEWAYWWRLCHRDLRTFSGHQGAIRAVAFSPDGRLVTGGDDRTIRGWDAATGRKILHLTWPYRDAVRSVALSPDGKRLAVAGNESKVVVIWESGTGRRRLLLKGHTRAIKQVAFAPEGRRIASAGADGVARVWDAGTGRELLALPRQTHVVYAVAFSPDGNRLATGGADRTVRIWDLRTGRELRILDRHFLEVTNVAFSPDGRRIASSSYDSTAKIWDTETGRELHTLAGHTNWIYGLAFSPDGQLLATASDDTTARLWKVTTGKLFRLLRGHTGWLRAIAFSPDGKRLATGSYDGTAKLWNVAAAPDSVTLAGHRGRIRSIAFSPDGRRIATAGHDHTAKLWNIATRRELLSLLGHTDQVLSVAFSPTGRWMATGSADCTTRIWDLTNGRALRVLRGHTKPVEHVGFAPDGHRLVTVGSDNSARIWEAATGRLLLTLRGHTAPVLTADFSPDGKRLATGGEDRVARVWDVTTGRQLLLLPRHTDKITSVAFSPDGTRLATAGNATTEANVWDAATGCALLRLRGHTDRVRAVGFSPDGTRLLTAGNDGRVKLWSLVKGRETLTLEGQHGNIYDAVFSPDGLSIAAGYLHGPVRIWTAASPEQIAAREAEGENAGSTAGR